MNPANQDLLLGGGIAGVIRRKGGEQIQAECNEIGHCDVGSAVITTAGDLPAKHVIHAVGPVYNAYSPEKAEELLASAIRSALEVVVDQELNSITIPAISSGIFGYPKIENWKVHIDTISEFLADTDVQLEVTFILYPPELGDSFRDAHDEYIGDIQEKYSG